MVALEGTRVLFGRGGIRLSKGRGNYVALGYSGAAVPTWQKLLWKSERQTAPSMTPSPNAVIIAK